MSGISTEEAGIAPLTVIRLTAEQSEFVRLDGETGQLDLPLSVIRSLSDWLRRYDLRPSTPRKPGRANP